MAPSPFYLLLSSPESPDALIQQAVDAWAADEWKIDANECDSTGKPLVFAVLERFADASDDSLLKRVLAQLNKAGLDATVAFDGKSSIAYAAQSDQWGAAMLLEAWGATIPGCSLQEYRQLSRLQSSLGLAAIAPEWFEELAHPLKGFGGFDARPSGLPLGLHPWVGHQNTPGLGQFLLTTYGPDRIKRSAESAFWVYSHVAASAPQSEFALWGWVTLGVLANNHVAALDQGKPERAQLGRGFDLWARYENKWLKRRYPGHEQPLDALMADLREVLVPSLLAARKDNESHATLVFEAASRINETMRFRESIAKRRPEMGAFSSGEYRLGWASAWVESISLPHWEQHNRSHFSSLMTLARHWVEGLEEQGFTGPAFERFASHPGAWVVMATAVGVLRVKEENPLSQALASHFHALPKPPAEILDKALVALGRVPEHWRVLVRDAALSSALPLPRPAGLKPRF